MRGELALLLPHLPTLLLRVLLHLPTTLSPMACLRMRAVAAGGAAAVWTPDGGSRVGGGLGTSAHVGAFLGAVHEGSLVHGTGLESGEFSTSVEAAGDPHAAALDGLSTDGGSVMSLSSSGAAAFDPTATAHSAMVHRGGNGGHAWGSSNAMLRRVSASLFALGRAGSHASHAASAEPRPHMLRTAGAWPLPGPTSPLHCPEPVVARDEAVDQEGGAVIEPRNAAALLRNALSALHPYAAREGILLPDAAAPVCDALCALLQSSLFCTHWDDGVAEPWGAAPALSRSELAAARVPSTAAAVASRHLTPAAVQAHHADDTASSDDSDAGEESEDTQRGRADSGVDHGVHAAALTDARQHLLASAARHHIDEWCTPVPACALVGHVLECWSPVHPTLAVELARSARQWVCACPTLTLRARAGALYRALLSMGALRPGAEDAAAVLAALRLSMERLEVSMARAGEQSASLAASPRRVTHPPPDHRHPHRRRPGGARCSSRAAHIGLHASSALVN